MEPAFGYWWILIPIVAILSKTIRGWMVFQTKQRQLGASTRELEQEVAALTKANAALTERVQNLETIVVSQTWGALQDRGLSPAERELKVATAAHRELGPAGRLGDRHRQPAARGATRPPAAIDAADRGSARRLPLA
jgi:hypothetical protein